MDSGQNKERSNQKKKVHERCNCQANYHIRHPETPFLAWPCNEKRRHERCKASNNDEEEEEEEEETLFDPKSTNVQITIPHISDIQLKQLCTHIYRHYVHKHSS